MIENVKSFLEFINESEKEKEINSALRATLDKMGESFESNDEIIAAIETLGFKLSNSGKERTADYVFLAPDGKCKYISFTSGYVRANKDVHSRWLGDTVNKTPLTKGLMPDLKDRLLFILRIALKQTELFNIWKKGNRTCKEIIEANYGTIAGKKYNI